jgi:hypothetical protein
VEWGETRARLAAWSRVDSTTLPGTFGPAAVRLPAFPHAFPGHKWATVSHPQPTLAVAGFGWTLGLRKRRPSGRGGVALVLAALVLLLMALPGGSPPWLANLAPRILMPLLERAGWMSLALPGAAFVLVWPVLHTHGSLGSLWLPILPGSAIADLLAVGPSRAPGNAGPALNEAAS